MGSFSVVRRTEMEQYSKEVLEAVRRSHANGEWEVTASDYIEPDYDESYEEIVWGEEIAEIEAADAAEEVKKTARRHTIFQLLMAVVIIAAIAFLSGCSFTVQVPNTFEFISYEDCSWEIIEADFGVQLLTGTTGCNDQ
jgi:hypothetical protein